MIFISVPDCHTHCYNSNPGKHSPTSRHLQSFHTGSSNATLSPFLRLKTRLIWTHNSDLWPDTILAFSRPNSYQLPKIKIPKLLEFEFCDSYLAWSPSSHIIISIQYHLLLDGFQREIIASTYIITLSENEIVNKDHILLIYALPTEDKKVFGKLNSKSILFKKSLQIGKQMN